MNICRMNASSCFAGQDKFVLTIFLGGAEKYADTEY